MEHYSKMGLTKRRFSIDSYCLEIILEIDEEYGGFSNWISYSWFSVKLATTGG